MKSRKVSKVVENPRQISKEIAKAFRAGKSKTIDNTRTDGESIFLHGNKIVRKNASGSISVTVGDHSSLTTKDRLSPFCKVTTKAGQLMLNGEPWDGNWKVVEDADGSLVKNPKPEKQKRIIAARKQAEKKFNFNEENGHVARLNATLSGGDKFQMIYNGKDSGSPFYCLTSKRSFAEGSIGAETKSGKVPFTYYTSKEVTPGSITLKPTVKGYASDYKKAFLKLIECYMNENYQAWNW